MNSETFKSQKLSSHEYYQTKRWEGKPLSFKFKFMMANYPELAFMFLTGLIGPAIAYMKWKNFPGSKNDAISKYKPNYTVVRDDDPNLEAIMKEKECGREYFPQ